MDPVSRRSFLVRGSAGLAGAAAATGGGITAIAGAAGAAPLTDTEVADLDQPVIVRVLDAATAEVEILVGDREVVFTDKALVAKLLRAGR